MKRAAVFFDRDNTLIASDGYLGDASRVVLVAGAAGGGGAGAGDGVRDGDLFQPERGGAGDV